MKEASCDILVLGSEPAAAAAAIVAAADGVCVHLVQQRPAAASERLEWIGPAAQRLLAELAVELDRTRAAGSFAGLILHAWDFSREIQVEDAELAGRVVPQDALELTLLKQAQQRGACAHAGAVSRCTVGEDAVRVELDDGTMLAGRIAIVCEPGQVEIHRPGQPPPAARSVCYRVQVATRSKGGQMHAALGRGGRLGLVLRGPRAVGLAAFVRRDDAEAREAFELLRRSACAAGLLPEEARGLEPRVEPVASGAALEAESHVRKRMLLAGSAGGFCGAFSHERIYPQLRSGMLAAQTAVAALKAGVLQDALMEFGPRWRSELADYLRMPNADLSLLLPLVFENRQMAMRVARALLLGEAL